MKKLNYTLIFLFHLICYSQKERQIVFNGNVYQSVIIELIHGHEPIKSYSIDIFSKGDLLIAKKIKPNYYYGEKTDSIWEIELNNSKIKFIQNFLKKAKKLNGECPRKSNVRTDYKIKLGNDITYNIYGDCKWKSFDYFSLEQKIFDNEFKKLYNLRSELKGSISKTLKGKWVVSGLKKENEIKRKDKIIFTRIVNVSDLSPDKVIWTFGDNFSFKNLVNNDFDFSYSNLYKLRVNEGGIYLDLEMGLIPPDWEFGNDGAHLTIREIEDNKIILDNFWR